MNEIIKILEKHGLTYEKTANIYNDLENLYLKNDKYKKDAGFLSSAIFEFKKYHIENK